MSEHYAGQSRSQALLGSEALESSASGASLESLESVQAVTWPCTMGHVSRHLHIFACNSVRSAVYSLLC